MATASESQRKGPYPTKDSCYAKRSPRPDPDCSASEEVMTFGFILPCVGSPGPSRAACPDQIVEASLLRHFHLQGSGSRRQVRLLSRFSSAPASYLQVTSTFSTCCGQASKSAAVDSSLRTLCSSCRISKSRAFFSGSGQLFGIRLPLPLSPMITVRMALSDADEAIDLPLALASPTSISSSSRPYTNGSVQNGAVKENGGDDAWLDLGLSDSIDLGLSDSVVVPDSGRGSSASPSSSQVRGPVLSLDRWRILRSNGPRGERSDRAGADGPRPQRPGFGGAVELTGSVDFSSGKDPRGLKTFNKPRPVKSREEEELEQERIRAAKIAASTVTKKKGKKMKYVDEFADEEENSLAVLGGLRPAPRQRPQMRTYVAPDVPDPLARPAMPKSAPAPPMRQPTRSFGSKKKTREVRPPKPQKPEKLVLTGPITVQDFSTQMMISAADIIKKLLLKGVRATLNHTLDIETASMVAQELEIAVQLPDEAAADDEKKVKSSETMLGDGDLEHLVRRPPIVTVMGHVDHGKTTLLDSVRKTKVAAGEAGGITQSVRAHMVDVDVNGETRKVVFLDTPGHEAFTAMRSRGAKVTDIAVLVVAADDGVRPQTIEAIRHAQAAGVPIIVAINKIDKEGANPERVKQELMDYGLMAEDWGGETVMVPISALKGEGLDTLLEMILLVSEVEDLYANPDRPAKGTIVEGHMDLKAGSVASLLVRNGTLRVGDYVVAGPAYGRVRALIGMNGAKVESAAPSTAVEVWGLHGVPLAGEEFDVVPSEKEARARAEEYALAARDRKMTSRVSLGSLSARVREGALKQLNVILKGDVSGSVEAIASSIAQLPQNQVTVRILISSPGNISKTDIDLASASDAVIIGFNVDIPSDVRSTADQAGVDVRIYDVIYQLLDEIQAAMEGLLEPDLVEEKLGLAEVRGVFAFGRGQVAGCYVKEGKLIRNCQIRVLRNGELVAEGSIDSLKRVKDDVKEVAEGYECGVNSTAVPNWKEGDVIEAFKMNVVRRKLDSGTGAPTAGAAVGASS